MLGLRLLFFFSTYLFVLHIASAQQPFLFEENKGQWHEEVLFRTEIPGGYLFVTKKGMKYVYVHPEDAGKFAGHDHQNIPSNLRTSKPDLQEGLRMHAIEVLMENRNPSSKIISSKPSASQINYFRGNDPSKWAVDVRRYEEVMIKNVYQNIDFKLYSERGNLKYDFIVRKGGNPSQIALAFIGAEGVGLVEDRLAISTAFSTTHEGNPYSYQRVGEGERPVTCRYQVDGAQVKFDLPEGYNKNEDLIIDPELIFSTYSGSLADNWGFTATYDEAGNLYSGGIVREIGYPVTSGAFQENYGGNVDVGILKFNEDGTQLLFATYIGGSSAETPYSMIVNSLGELVILGTTSSSNFPVTTNAYQTTYHGGPSLGQPVGAIPYTNGSDFYVLKLSSDGRDLISSTFLGGTDNDGVMLQRMPLTKNYGDQFRGEVNIDKDDNIYFASYTASQDFPITSAIQLVYGGGLYDGVVVKFNPDLSDLLFSAYLGGKRMDGVFNVKVDSDNNIVVGGGTDSEDYPIKGSVLKPEKNDTTDIDGVISKISVTGDSLIASTYVGTVDYDQVYFIEVDSSDLIYVLGQTRGDIAITADLYSNPNSGQFVQCYGQELDTLIFSTQIGSGSGSPDFRPTAFLVNECQNILISGWGGSTNAALVQDNSGNIFSTGYVGGTTVNLPVTDNAFRPTSDGSDFYICVLLKDAKELLYATFFGGNTSSDHVDGGTSRFDNRGIVYQSVCASCGLGAVDDFPTTPGAWSNVDKSKFPGPNCNNAVFKFDVTQLKADFVTNSLEWDRPGLRTGCWPLEIAFKNTSIGGIDFEWDLGNGISSTQEDSLYTIYENPGLYNVSLRATDISTCVREDFAFGTIEVYDQTFEIMDPEKICHGDQVQMMAGGGVSYKWSPSQYLDNPNIQNPTASPDTTAYFTVEVTNGLGCVAVDSVLITVVPGYTVDFNYSKVNSCFISPEIYFHNLSSGVDEFVWDLGNGDQFSLDSLGYNYHETDTFTVTLTGLLDICEKTVSQQVPSVATIIPNVITPNGDQLNDVFQIITDEPIDLKIVSRWGNLVFEAENYSGEFDGKGLPPAVYYYEVEFRKDGTSCNGWLHILK